MIDRTSQTGQLSFTYMKRQNSLVDPHRSIYAPRRKAKNNTMEQQQQKLSFNWNNMCAKENLENGHLLLPTLPVVDELNNPTVTPPASNKCQCCPYGYHIDVDFVRYCEALANGSYLKQLKQLRRSRRRQRKSMEALLHCHEENNKYLEEQRMTGDNTPCSGPPPDLLGTSNDVRDALREAMLDFEETFEKSQKNSSTRAHTHPSSSTSTHAVAIPSLDLLTNAHQSLNLQVSPLSPKTLVPLPLSSSRSRSDSTSSLNSVSTVSSFATEHIVLPSQQMADTMATLNNSVVQSSPTTTSVHSGVSNGTSSYPTAGMVNMNKATLHSIREQMATSLQRMRELEEHVKNIPILQVKLSVLKEEKRLLMLQLKAKAAKLDHRSIGVGDNSVADMSLEEMGQRLDRLGAVGVTSPKSRRKMLAGDRNRSRSESPDSFTRNKLVHLTDFQSHYRINGKQGELKVSFEDLPTLDPSPKTQLYLREMRSVGVNCSVLTRDVGVSHIQPHTRSIGVGDVNPSSNFCVICKEREDKHWNFKGTPPPVSPKKKSIAVNTDALATPPPKPRMQKLTMSACNIESLPPGTCQQCDKRQKIVTNHIGISTEIPTDDYLDMLLTQHKKKSKLRGHDKGVNTTPLTTLNRGTNTGPPNQRSTFMNTDLHMGNVVNREEFDIIAQQAVLTKSVDTANIGVQTPPQTPVKTKETFTQMKPVEEMKQPVPVKSPVATKDFAVNANMAPKTVDKGIGYGSVLKVVCDQCQNLTRKTVGVGNYSVNDVVCDRCSSLRTRSFGVGDARVSDVLCPKCSVAGKQRTVGCGNASITDSLCPKCENTRSVTIGVGIGDVNTNTCDSCSNRKFVNVSVGSAPDVKSVQTNTIKDGERLVNGELHLCEKCKTSISPSSIPPPLPSRIPRLAMGVTETATTSIQSTVVNVKSVETSSSQPKRFTRSEMMGGQRETSGFANQGFQKASPPKDSLLNKRNGHLNQKFRCVTETTRQTSSSHQPITVVDNSDSSDSSDSDSSESPDEGSYDGVHGNIVHTCHDDEAIRQGLPGAAMFQPIQDKPRIKHKLSDEMLSACKILQEHEVKPNHAPSKALNSSMNLIQQEWFRVSSQNKSDPHLVEDYMDAFEDLSRTLLSKVVNMCDANGNTAMHYAVSHGNFDVVGLLLDSKVCDVNKQNKAGYTCIMLASLAPVRNDIDQNILHRLFQIGDVNIKASQHGQTALMLGVSHGRLDVVKMLTEVGADVNIQDEDGSTALMCASEHGHIDIVRHILSQPDCDPTLTDNDNSTALAIAMEANHKDIGVLIYAHMNISKGSSPHGSFRGKRRTSSLSSTPPPRTPPPPPSPAPSRRSTTSMP